LFNTTTEGIVGKTCRESRRADTGQPVAAVPNIGGGVRSVGRVGFGGEIAVVVVGEVVGDAIQYDAGHAIGRIVGGGEGGFAGAGAAHGFGEALALGVVGVSDGFYWSIVRFLVSDAEQTIRIIVGEDLLDTVGQRFVGKAVCAIPGVGRGLAAVNDGRQSAGIVPSVVSGVGAIEGAPGDAVEGVVCVADGVLSSNGVGGDAHHTVHRVVGIAHGGAGFSHAADATCSIVVNAAAAAGVIDGGHPVDVVVAVGRDLAFAVGKLA
jgi:hypothetical protein